MGHEKLPKKSEWKKDNNNIYTTYHQFPKNYGLRFFVRVKVGVALLVEFVDAEKVT